MRVIQVLTFAVCLGILAQEADSKPNAEGLYALTTRSDDGKTTLTLLESKHSNGISRYDIKINGGMESVGASFTIGCLIERLMTTRNYQDFVFLDQNEKEVATEQGVVKFSAQKNAGPDALKEILRQACPKMNIDIKRR